MRPKLDKILVIGKNGQVGNALLRLLGESDNVLYTTSKETDNSIAFDLTDQEQIRNVIRRSNPKFIINPAAYTHTSVAIHDALKSLIIPSIEIHLSQPAKRESFRHKSLIAEVVNGTISGFGPNSYLLAMKAIDDLLKTNTES